MAFFLCLASVLLGAAVETLLHVCQERGAGRVERYPCADPSAVLVRIQALSMRTSKRCPCPHPSAVHARIHALLTPAPSPVHTCSHPSAVHTALSTLRYAHACCETPLRSAEEGIRDEEVAASVSGVRVGV
eukprot:364735-Chlamydomonas_euryale.AAC.14